MIVEDAVEVGKGWEFAGMLLQIGMAILSCETVEGLSFGDFVVGRTIAALHWLEGTLTHCPKEWCFAAVVLAHFEVKMERRKGSSKGFGVAKKQTVEAAEPLGTRVAQ